MNKSGFHLAKIVTFVVFSVLCAPFAQAQSSNNLAPNFTVRAAASKLVIVPADMELFSVSGGGVSEPKADWTAAAQKHVKSAMSARKAELGVNVADLDEKLLDEFAEVNALHGAVAQSVFRHHMIGGVFKLPTKNGVLNWSMGDSVLPLKQRTGADYALFIWIRDSYATAERKAVMVGMALLGVGVSGGSQIGYASLIDLNNGQVVWFNDLRRGTGDLREEDSAAETVSALLKGFPGTK